ncbi:MAG: hypothetical protein D6741_21235 [Planctomycetota bacterium]|nr:MAG: hypothetical protein D6741_21235 [Planctomycetota bacterium]
MITDVSASRSTIDQATFAANQATAARGSQFAELLESKMTEPSSSDAVAETDDEELRDAFRSFVGQTLFGMMLKEMRKSVHKTPYFHGGQAEEIFQQHLDMTLAEKMADAAADRFSDPMFELFELRRR